MNNKGRMSNIKCKHCGVEMRKEEEPIYCKNCGNKITKCCKQYIDGNHCQKCGRSWDEIKKQEWETRNCMANLLVIMMCLLLVIGICWIIITMYEKMVIYGYEVLIEGTIKMSEKE